MQEALSNHLKTGSTTVCRAWIVKRKDGVILGFTDHDEDLDFDDVLFAARSGLTAFALQKTTGMAVDNTEAMGALSDASVREEDILAGRYDGAEVIAYLVNWANVSERSVLFRGTFGEMVRSQGTFRVELRGLTEALNTPSGRVYHSGCGAVFGDSRCRVDLTLPSVTRISSIVEVHDGRILLFGGLEDFPDGWFVGGHAELIGGVGKGQIGRVKSDRLLEGVRYVELWQSFGLRPHTEDFVRLVAGCDKMASTCRTKFDNFLNFRGFPHIPGEDWLRSNPSISVRR